jgi:hypothetical protein
MQPTIHVQKKPDILISVASFFGNVVWVGFFILSGPLLLVNNPVLLHEQVKKVLVSKYLKITYFFMKII